MGHQGEGRSPNGCSAPQKRLQLTLSSLPAPRGQHPRRIAAPAAHRNPKTERSRCFCVGTRDPAFCTLLLNMLHGLLRCMPNRHLAGYRPITCPLHGTTGHVVRDITTWHVADPSAHKMDVLHLCSTLRAHVPLIPPQRPPPYNVPHSCLTCPLWPPARASIQPWLSWAFRVSSLASCPTSLALPLSAAWAATRGRPMLPSRLRPSRPYAPFRSPARPLWDRRPRTLP